MQIVYVVSTGDTQTWDGEYIHVITVRTDMEQSLMVMHHVIYFQEQYLLFFIVHTS